MAWPELSSLIHGPLPLFVVQAILIILTSRLVGGLARLVGQPLVIAEIAAGIMLGPSLLGWLAPSVLDAVFPARSMPALGLLSQIGLLLFMFLVGLEFDPRVLRGRAHSSVAISHSSIILPFGLGALLAFPLYPRVSDPSVPFSSFVLFLGVAMSVTAFPVLARILVERRLLGTKIGGIAITCAAVDDVTAWCLLAFVVAAVRSHAAGEAIRTTVLSLAYIAFLVVAVRPFLRRLSSRVSSERGLTSNLIAGVFCLVLLSSWATELIGIHAVFGAFLIGAVMPKGSGLSQAFAHRIEDVVVVFFLPLFFAYSGLRTQIGLLDTAEDWILCGSIIAVACVGKFVGSAVAGKLTGLDWRESAAVGVLMNTRGLMELVVLNIGLDLGVISPSLFTMMVLMALVTTFLTTPLLRWIYPTASMTPEHTVEVRAPHPRPELTVLMCVAYERAGPALATVARALIGDHPATAVALHLVEPETDALAPRTADSQGILEPLLVRAKEIGLAVSPISFVSSQPATDILALAQAKRADLVLTGWNRSLIGEGGFGLTTTHVMKEASAVVGSLLDRGLTEVRRVLVPSCGDENDRAALAIAQRLQRQHHAEVTTLLVERELEPSAADAGRGRSMTGPSGWHGDRTKVVRGTDPVRAILAEAKAGYDLVVVGAGEQWGLELRALGMQPARLARECPVSMLVVHAGASARGLLAAAPAPSLAPDPAAS